MGENKENIQEEKETVSGNLTSESELKWIRNLRYLRANRPSSTTHWEPTTWGTLAVTQDIGKPYLIFTRFCLLFGPNAYSHRFARLDTAQGRMSVALTGCLPGSQVGEGVCRDFCYLFLTMEGMCERKR